MYLNLFLVSVASKKSSKKTPAEPEQEPVASQKRPPGRSKGSTKNKQSNLARSKIADESEKPEARKSKRNVTKISLNFCANFSLF
jgi:hypothetical protein